MATYRCPECGAAHKEQVRSCRLCGAPLDSPVTVRTATVDQSIAASRFRRKGLGHFMIIGVVLVCLIGLGAFLLGGVEDSEAERWFYKLPFVDPPVEDAWFEWADPAERIIVEVPAKVEEAAAEDAVDLGADTSTFVTSVGNDRFVLGYTDGLGFTVPDTGDDRRRSSTEAALRDAVEGVAASQGGYVQRFGDLFTFGDDHLAVDAVVDGISLQQGPGFGSIRLVMVDDEVYFVETIAYERNTESHLRVRGSLVIVSDDPDIAIPTVPADAAEPGGIVNPED